MDARGDSIEQVGQTSKVFASSRRHAPRSLLMREKGATRKGAEEGGRYTKVERGVRVEGHPVGRGISIRAPLFSNAALCVAHARGRNTGLTAGDRSVRGSVRGVRVMKVPFRVSDQDVVRTRSSEL